MESKVREIRRKTRRKYSAEEKIRIVLEGLRGEESIAELCRREGIAPNLHYSWNKEFLEAGKRRMMGDTKRQATSGEVRTLRQENSQLKELLENYYLPWELEHQIGRFVDYYNHRRVHESLDNLTPADVYHGRGREIITARNLVKEKTMRRRRRRNLGRKPLSEEDY